MAAAPARALDRRSEQHHQKSNTGEKFVRPGAENGSFSSDYLNDFLLTRWLNFLKCKRESIESEQWF